MGVCSVRVVEALIYCRVSEDRAQGRSVAEQEVDARAVCQREGWTVADVVTDSVGASRHSKGTRHGWEAVRQTLEGGAVDVLVTWEASRAQRDLEAYAELRALCARTGTLWCYSGRVHDLTNSGDRFVTGLDALLAEREADEISARVRRSIRANAVKGSPHGRRLFGYTRTYDPTTGALTGQVPDEHEAPVVQRIFADYLAGMGIRTIARGLNSEQITTGTGSHWRDKQVARVLDNPAYAGIRVHRGEVVGPAAWPALIATEDWERTCTRREVRSAARTPNTGTARLLTGVSRCGLCGGRMLVGHDRGGRKVYQCRAGYCVARDEAKLDAYVTELLLTRMASADLGVAERPATEADRAELDHLRARIEEAVDQFTAGKLTGATLARIEGRMLPAIAAVESRIRRSVVPIGVSLPVGDPWEWWAALTPEVRREVVGGFLASVVVLPTKRGSRTFDPAAVRVEWR